MNCNSLLGRNRDRMQQDAYGLGKKEERLGQSSSHFQEVHLK
jgi:hypothetical protein